MTAPRTPSASGARSRLKATARTVAFRTKWFTVEAESFDHIKALKGKPYYRLCGADGVLVVALTTDGRIILIQQFRPALNEHTLEVPCGHIDVSESPRQAAARELYEETGYVCKDLRLLGVGRVKMDRVASHEYAFLGTGAVKDPKFGTDEDIQVRLVTPARFKQLVVSGKFHSWSALASLLLADWRLGFRLGEPSRRKGTNHD